MRAFAIGIASALFAGFMGQQAQAQTQQQFVDAFAGDWQVVDSRYAGASGACEVSLRPRQPTEGRYPVEISGCQGEMSLVAGWGISDGQMSLFDAAGTSIARLGGNQRRMSGNSAGGAPIILERVGAGGTAALLEAAKNRAGCFYAGFTDTCAPEAQMSKPADADAKVQVIVNLNIRAEAREDAGILGVVPVNSCISTELCMTATDGVWCRARFNDSTGWLRKLALRQNRWPVVTFLNSCPENG